MATPEARRFLSERERVSADEVKSDKSNNGVSGFAYTVVFFAFFVLVLKDKATVLHIHLYRSFGVHFLSDDLLRQFVE